MIRLAIGISQVRLHPLSSPPGTSHGEMDGEFLDRIDIRRRDFHRSDGVHLFALFPGDPVETGPSRRTATAAMKDEKTMKSGQ